jgi:hypothetical protein
VNDLNNILNEKYEKRSNDRLFEEISKKSKFINSPVINECEEEFYKSAVHILNRSSHELAAMDIRQNNMDIKLKTFHNNMVEDVSAEYDTTIIKILKALYVPDGVLYETHTVASDDIITMEIILDGIYKLGDKSNELKISMFHPKIFRQLKEKTDPEDYKKKTGMQIIECDLLPTSEKEKYFSFLIGKNSISFKNTRFETQVQLDRRIGGGTYYIHTTAEFYLYLNGVIFNFNRNFPYDKDLENPHYWERITKNDKDIKIVALLTKVK